MSGRRGWNLAAMLVGEIVLEPYSHLRTALAGWSYVPPQNEVLFLDWVDAQAQMHHRSGKVPPKPVVRPWTLNNDPQEVMPDPERSERRSALRERLGLGYVARADDDPDIVSEPSSQ